MVLITTSKKLWLLGMAVSLVIFGVLYFTVIKPSSDSANQAIKSGIQQSQQALNQATKQLQGASSQAGGVSTQAQKTLSKAAQLTSCLSTAGTDVAKVEACQTQFGN
jgi:peptidoglycan hydrolase CwlO-like protein